MAKHVLLALRSFNRPEIGSKRRRASRFSSMAEARSTSSSLQEKKLDGVWSTGGSWHKGGTYWKKWWSGGMHNGSRMERRIRLIPERGLGGASGERNG